MQITSKRQLKFVLQADYMMNRGKFKPSIADRIHNIFSPDYIMSYLIAMRKTSYYRPSRGLFGRLCFLWHYNKYKRLGLKLGFSIGYHALGYGVVIPHYGTIVIGETNRIGNFAVIHTSTCITDNGKVIGDGLYLSAGVKMTSKLVLGDNALIGSNSLVNKSFEKNNLIIGGAPATIIKNGGTWYGQSLFEDRRNMILELKTKYEQGK